MHVIKKVRTPGNRLAFHRERSKVGVRLCANCGMELSGLPRQKTVELSRTSKTKKSVSRAYGGNLCTCCTRNALKEKAFNL